MAMIFENMVLEWYPEGSDSRYIERILWLSPKRELEPLPVVVVVPGDELLLVVVVVPGVELLSEPAAVSIIVLYSSTNSWTSSTCFRVVKVSVIKAVFANKYSPLLKELLSNSDLGL
ncbi:hypothetical protein E8L90_21670 [Brevibacillus antibioticus]|uniref:Uncharacterized protein n=1 Tax=Brevibacillus antibioticus TaxID=2570228 RepID=A0A4U2YAR7_9BACL|nr:hypothetical protein [Brevibacillus antibioticus]TKI57828.1 hypothetical protein E8L90_21670 [Brevibacillus antibioticus]